MRRGVRRHLSVPSEDEEASKGLTRPSGRPSSFATLVALEEFTHNRPCERMLRAHVTSDLSIYGTRDFVSLVAATESADSANSEDAKNRRHPSRVQSCDRHAERAGQDP